MDIAGLRAELNLSQEGFARALGISSKGYISELESGHRTPSPRLAVRIEKLSGGKIRAEALNPAVAELRQ